MTSVNAHISSVMEKNGDPSKITIQSPFSLHKLMNLPTNRSYSLVSAALSTEMAYHKLKRMAEADSEIMTYLEDGLELITQNCVDPTEENIDCTEEEIRLQSQLPGFDRWRHYSFDGTCNNLARPSRGATSVALRRLLPAAYDALPAKPRQTSVLNVPLPGARTVSNGLSQGTQINGQLFTTLGLVWGQFTDHDITLTCAGNFESELNCEETCSDVPRDSCLPIDITGRRDVLSCRECIPFVRSCPVCMKSRDCKLGQREQLNQITPYIDASGVYGQPDAPEPNFWKNLVDLSTGKMRVSVSASNTDLLPEGNSMCVGGCFLTGDERGNEQPLLTALHTIFVREHNRLVDRLRRLNLRWSPSRLFLEARRIVAAEIQNIVQTEFIPLLLGGSPPPPDQEWTGYYYDKNIDPTITNAFATASYRFGHSGIPEFLKRVDSTFSEIQPLLLFQGFFNTKHIRQSSDEGGLDSILRGATMQGAFKVDNVFSNSIRNQLFQINQSTEIAEPNCGLDLVSLNIQRGREHGLPSYNEYREFAFRKCGVTSGRVRSFEDLKRDIPADTVNILRSIYRNVNDIDLFAGGISERQHISYGGNRAAIGPTFWCLNRLQFINIRLGDRLWYENSRVFTRRQLREIRKVTLAKILCNNGDNITRIPRQVMKYSRSPQIVDCSNIPDLNLFAWKEYRYRRRY